MPQQHLPRLTPAPMRTSTKAAFLVALTVLAYLTAFRNGFIWDDDAWLMHNRTLEGLNGLYRLWFDLLALQQYYPSPAPPSGFSISSGDFIHLAITP